jgi:hypothetical protein
LDKKDLVFVTGRRRYNRSVDGRVLGLCLALAACSRPAPRPAPTKSGLDTYLLRVRVSGNGEVSVGRLGNRCADDCTYHVLRGKTVELTAIGKQDVFHRWSNRCGEDTACKITMSSNRSVRAEFGLDRYEPAWAVPLTSDNCVALTGLAVGEQVVVTGDVDESAALGHVKLTTHGHQEHVVAALRRSSGDVVWTRQFGQNGLASVSSPQVSTSGEVVVRVLDFAQGQTGLLSEEILWMNGDSGTTIDSVPIAGHVRSIRRLNDGGMVALADGLQRFTVVRYGSSRPHSVRWTRDLLASGSLQADDIAIGSDGDVFVAGDLDVVDQFAAQWSGKPRTKPGRAPFLLRLDGETGTIKTARWIDWKGDRFIAAMSSDGPMVILGGGARRDRELDSFVSALSLDGGVVWDLAALGDPDSFPGSSISSVDASGGVIAIAGSTSGKLYLGGREIGEPREDTSFIGELSNHGDVLWVFARPMGPLGIHALSRDDEGDLYVVGWFNQAFEFAGHTIEPHPSRVSCRSAFVARFARTGDRSPGSGL